MKKFFLKTGKNEKFVISFVRELYAKREFMLLQMLVER